jgi:thioredoxin-related protein
MSSRLLNSLIACTFALFAMGIGATGDTGESGPAVQANRANAPQGGAAVSTAADGKLPSPYAIDIPKWFTETLLDFREDVADAARERKRVMVYFGQDGCPYCAALMKVNFSQQDIVARTRAGFVAIALNIWGDREVTWTDGRAMSEKQLARMLNVQFTPTILFLDEHGGIALRLNGYQPPERFRLALDYVLLHREQPQSFTEFLARNPPHRASRPAPVRIGERTTDLIAPRGGTRKPLLVLYEQQACRDCDELHSAALSRPELKRLLGRFRVARLDFLGRRMIVTPAGKRISERDWANELSIVYTPTLVFFDVHGAEVFRADGYLRPFHLASTLEYVAGGAYREEPNFQRFIKARAEAERGRGRSVDLWQ